MADRSEYSDDPCEKLMFSCQQAKPAVRTEIPCNLDMISLMVTPQSSSPVGLPMKRDSAYYKDAISEKIAQPVTVWNSYPAMAAPDGLISPEDEQLFNAGNHAVYVHVRTPFSGPQEGAAKWSSEANEHSTTDTRWVDVEARVEASERCGHHPTMKQAEQAEQRGDHSARTRLTITRAGYREGRQFEWIKQALVHGKLLQLFDTITDVKEFEFTSCGHPSLGRGRTRFTGLARLSSLNDMSFSVTPPEGFSLEWGTKRSNSSGAKGKPRVSRREYVRPDGSGKTRRWSEEKVIEGADAGTWSQVVPPGEEDPYDPFAYTPLQNESTSSETEDFVVGAGDVVRDAVDYSAKKYSSAMSKARFFAVSVNGVKFSSEEIDKGIKDFFSAVQVVTDWVMGIIGWIQDGLRIGFPWTVSFGYSAKIVMLRGSLTYRSWAEQGQPVIGSSYYVDQAKPHWQLRFNGSALDVTGVVSMSAMIQIIHKKIASLELIGSLTVRVDVRGRIVLQDGDKPYKAVVQGSAPIVLKAVCEGKAGPLYLLAELPIKGTVTATKSWDFKGLHFTKDAEESKITSSQVTMRLECWAGKVKHELTVEGRGEPFYRYPKEGDLVLARKGTICTI